MSETVLSVTPGSGDDIASDEIATKNYQRIKIVDGVTDSTTPLKVVVEDTPHVSGDSGILAMAVRNDGGATSFSGANGDYTPISVDQYGRLILGGSAVAVDVAIGDAVQISEIVGAVTPGVSAANLGKAEDAAHSSGDTGVAVWGVRRDSPVSGVGADGDYASFNLDASGRLYVTAPAEKTLTIVTGTVASSGDNSLVAAPGVGVKIVVCGCVIQNESATATTLILRDGTTSKIRCYAKNQGDGLSQVFTPDARWKLTANTALNLNLSGANTCGYTVWYYTE